MNVENMHGEKIKNVLYLLKYETVHIKLSTLYQI